MPATGIEPVLGLIPEVLAFVRFLKSSAFIRVSRITYIYCNYKYVLIKYKNTQSCNTKCNTKSRYAAKKYLNKFNFGC